MIPLSIAIIDPVIQDALRDTASTEVSLECDAAAAITARGERFVLIVDAVEELQRDLAAERLDPKER